MTISKQVALFPVIQLEKLTGLYQKLFPLPGYHVSAYDLILTGHWMDKKRFLLWLFSLGFSSLILSAVLAAPLLRASGLRLADFIYLSFSSVCHQIPERSYHLAGNPLAVCSRCLGVYAGFFTGILVYPLLPRQTVKWAEKRGYLIILTSIPLLIDAAGGILRLWISPLPLRSISGFVWAFSFPVYWFKALFELAMSRRKNERN